MTDLDLDELEPVDYPVVELPPGVPNYTDERVAQIGRQVEVEGHHGGLTGRSVHQSGGLCRGCRRPDLRRSPGGGRNRPEAEGSSRSW